MEGLEGELVLGLNQAPSMNAVLRALKKEEASMFCCVASIAQDAQFVQQVFACRPACAVRSVSTARFVESLCMM